MKIGEIGGNKLKLDPRIKSEDDRKKHGFPIPPRPDEDDSKGSIDPRPAEAEAKTIRSAKER